MPSYIEYKWIMDKAQQLLSTEKENAPQLITEADLAVLRANTAFLEHHTHHVNDLIPDNTNHNVAHARFDLDKEEQALFLKIKMIMKPILEQQLKIKNAMNAKQQTVNNSQSLAQNEKAQTPTSSVRNAHTPGYSLWLEQHKTKSAPPTQPTTVNNTNTLKHSNHQ